MPRVVPDQREKFENDELFRKMSRESEVSAVWLTCYAIVIDYRSSIAVVKWAYDRRLRSPAFSIEDSS